jgi:hypothetical protein
MISKQPIQLSDFFTPSQIFQTCHLTFLRSIYLCNTEQQGGESIQSDTADIKLQESDLFQHEDVKAIESFLYEREKILMLKEHAFKIKLMYEESLLQFHPDNQHVMSQIQRNDDSKKMEVRSSSAPKFFLDHGIMQPPTSMPSKPGKEIDSGLNQANNPHSSVSVHFLSKILKRQHAEAEAHVGKGIEPFNTLTQHVQRRIERLEGVLRDSLEPMGSSIRLNQKTWQKFILETQYKIQLWKLLLETLNATLSI